MPLGKKNCGMASRVVADDDGGMPGVDREADCINGLFGRGMGGTNSEVMADGLKSSGILFCRFCCCSLSKSESRSLRASNSSFRMSSFVSSNCIHSKNNSSTLYCGLRMNLYDGAGGTGEVGIRCVVG